MDKKNSLKQLLIQNQMIENENQDFFIHETIQFYSQNGRNKPDV